MAGRRLRIVHVIASLGPQYGGPSAAIVPMCAALAHRGHDVSLYTTDRGSVDRHAVERLRSQAVSVRVFRSQAPVRWGPSLDLRGALRDVVGRTDVFHIHSLYLFHTWAASRAAIQGSTPYVVRPHGTLNDYHRQKSKAAKRLYDALIERRTLAAAGAVHFTSQDEAQQALRAGYCLNPAVIPLGVDLPPPDPEFLRRLTQKTGGQLLITCYGRLAEKKRLPLVIDAFASVPSQEAVLVIAGPDENGLEAHLRKRAAEAGVFDRVVFLGRLNRAEGAALLKASALVALPSADENFGLSVAEAQYAGTPVAVTDAVAIASLIRSTRSGYVVSPSREALATAFEQAIKHPEDREDRGSRGARMVRERFSWELVAEQLESLYSALARR